MKQMLLSAMVVSLLFCTVSSALAKETNATEEPQKQAFLLTTGQDLVDLCSLDKKSSLYEKSIGFCYGYASGAMSFYGAIAKSPKVPKIVCSDHMITRNEVVQTFLNWAKNNPQHLTESPIDSLLRAVVAKWPCSKKE